MTRDFVAHNAVLLGSQAALVGLTGAGLPAWLRRFATPRWALALPLSIGVVVGAIALLPDVADVLTWVALILVPPGAALPLGWAATVALHFEAVWLYRAGTSARSRGLPASWYAVFLVIRLGGVLWLLARTWQLALARAPVLDDDGAVVDSPWGDEDSDELAGPLRGEPDRLVVRFG